MGRRLREWSSNERFRRTRNAFFSARSFENNDQYGWVTRLLNNKVKIGRYVALQQSMSYTEFSENIVQGMRIMAAVTPIDINQAIHILGIDDPDFDASIRIRSAPRNVQTLIFDAPLDDGGSPVTGYMAECTNGDLKQIIQSSSSPLSLSELQAGKRYTCFVRSINRFGSGINSNLFMLSVDVLDLNN